MALNKVMLIGNLCDNPQITQTSSGNSVVNVSLATNERWKDKAGQQQERTEFHRLVVWGRLAEIFAQFLHKGSKVYVEGSLQTRKWQDRLAKNGSERWTTEINVRNMDMLDSKSERQEQSAPAPSSPATSDKDDLPF